jgi:hypothetical protein
VITLDVEITEPGRCMSRPSFRRNWLDMITEAFLRSF